jgi:hypothetical protein
VKRARALVVCAAALVGALLASTARADDDDGVYGRLEGDLDLRAGAGASFASGGPSFAAMAAINNHETAGVYVRYADAAGSSAPSTRRSIATGIHIQPFFLARYATNGEHGPARLDLLVDSFAVELGAAWQAQEQATFDPEPGLEVGLTLAAPFFARASGPFLEVTGALRWRGGDLRGPAGEDAVDRGAFLSLTLAWHQVVPVHLVDFGDTVRK